MADNDRFATWLAQENHNRRCRQKIANKAAANRKIADAIKMELGCKDCGYKENPKALQFDHRDGTKKKMLVSQMVKRATSSMLAEIQKCDVRCANCHIIKTYVDRQHMPENRTHYKKDDENPHKKLFCLK